MIINFKKYLYLNMCFSVSKEIKESKIEDIIVSNVNYLQKNKDFSFDLYTLKEGNDLSFNINNNEFFQKKNKFNMTDAFKNFLHKDLSNEEKKRKGLLKFSIGTDFHYSNNYVTLDKVNNKLIGKKKNIPFFKKTYNLKDFIGVFTLMENTLDLSKLSYKIKKDGSITILTFYRKESTGIINNFMIFALYDEELHDALICIDGEYILFRIENNMEKHKEQFKKFIIKKS